MLHHILFFLEFLCCDHSNAVSDFATKFVDGQQEFFPSMRMCWNPPFRRFVVFHQLLTVRTFLATMTISGVIFQVRDERMFEDQGSFSKRYSRIAGIGLSRKVYSVL